MNKKNLLLSLLFCSSVGGWAVHVSLPVAEVPQAAAVSAPVVSDDVSTNRNTLSRVASLTPGQDVTYLLTNPNFNDGLTGWEISYITSGDIRGSESNPNVGVCSSGNHCAYQIVTGIPNGLYRLKVQGFQSFVYSFHMNEFPNAESWKYYSNGQEKTKGYIYASSYGTNRQQTLKNIWDELRIDYKSVYASYYEVTDTLNFKKGVPSSPEAVSQAFDLGLYENELTIMVTDNRLKVGICTSGSNWEIWSFFDNFRLEYLGSSKEVCAEYLNSECSSQELVDAYAEAASALCSADSADVDQFWPVYFKALAACEEYHLLQEGGWHLNINVDEAGSLLDLIFEQPELELQNQVKYLTLSGTLDGKDFFSIKNADCLSELVYLDMTDVEIESLPGIVGLSNLRVLKLPRTLKRIGEHAIAGCSGLTYIEIPDSVTSIGESAFYGCTNLRNIVLPNSVTSLGSHVFENCSSLQSVIMSDALTSIPKNAFSNTALLKLDIGDRITSIGGGAIANCGSLRTFKCSPALSYIYSNAFSGCTALESIDFNENLQEIGDEAFMGCVSLKKIELHEGLRNLGFGAFFECDGLEEVVLPSSLRYCESEYYGIDMPSVFSGCDNIKTVKCYAILPPMLDGGNSILGDGSPSNTTLYVPTLSINQYKQTIGWDVFHKIASLEGEQPKLLDVYRPYTIRPTIRPIEKMDINICHFYDIGYDISREGGAVFGSLKIKGSSEFPVKNFSMYNDLSLSYQCNLENYNDNRRTQTCMTSLINEAAINADTVSITYRMPTNGWNSISLPYDVKMSEIGVDDRTNWVIRYYDGAKRAEGADKNATWVTLTMNDTLKAHQGYILQCSHADQYYADFVFPALDNANKNNIFAHSATEVKLQSHEAELRQNRHWNLVGNPFPCYYDTRRLDFDAPITVFLAYEYWGGFRTGYRAYSPIDDDYILLPGEAFFIQKPETVDAILFPTEGRQTDIAPLPLSSAGSKSFRRSPAYASQRKVFNLYLKQGEMNDRARFVINEAASADYDSRTDASKFRSDDVRSLELYTLDKGVEYAIQERPLADGIVRLGARFGKADTYTLSLETKAADRITLIDHVTKIETVLNDGDYTFEAEAGESTDRFEIRIGDVSGVESAQAAKTLRVWSENGRISIADNDNATAEVYTADGRLVTRRQGNGRISVAPGVYIVKVNNLSYKVAVYSNK